MNALPALLRAELLKVRTSRVTWVLLGGMVLVTIVMVALTLANYDADELAGARGVREVLTIGGGVACFFALALGAVGMAGEYRHGTIGHALLAAPARWPVVVAKLLAYAAAGLLLGIVALAVTLAIGVPGLSAEDAGISESSGLLGNVVLGTLVSAALFAAIGVGLAALLRDQTLALVAGLGWILLVETALTTVAPEVVKFLPGGAATALLHGQTHDVLPAGLAGIVLFAYASAFALAGALAAQRRDLTANVGERLFSA